MQAYHFSLCFVYQKKFREKYNIYFSCSGSFTGEKCDVELCDDASYCKNGGTCTFNNNHTGNKACQCAPGYTGMSIQINFSNVHWSNPYSFFHAHSYRIMGKYKCRWLIKRFEFRKLKKNTSFANRRTMWSQNVLSMCRPLQE